MTVASEITRLQWAKADIRQAIIDKWVDVWASLTLDQYADCIGEIPTWPNYYFVDVLAVWWWGGGWQWWGWGWGHNISFWHRLSQSSTCIKIWAGGSWHWTRQTAGGNWWDTCFWELKACWWHWWYICDGWDSYFSSATMTVTQTSKCSRPAGWASASCSLIWSMNWAPWPSVCFHQWVCVQFGWWWWGQEYSYWRWNGWAGWWWNWAPDGYDRIWCPANNYWWGWGGSNWCWQWWAWCKWIVIVWYCTNWDCWFTCATWWNSCKTCNWYKIHCFTSDWTFTIVS